MLRQLRGRKSNLFFLPFLFALLSNWTTGLPSFASIAGMKEALPDDYLEREFSWTMVVYQPDRRDYLKYPGSKLWPLTNIRVDLRTYPPGQTGAATTLYEDLWYHDHLPMGLRRHHEIAIAEQSIGAIIICPADDTSDVMQRDQAVTDAIVRLLVDVQFRKAVTGLVLVPADEYDSIASTLSQYNFFPAGPRVNICPVNLHLQAYPEGRDEFFYFQK